MFRILSMCLDAAIAAVLLAPVFFILNIYCFHNRNRASLYFLFAVYLSAMFAVVGLPDIRYIRFDPHFNFVPFRYMFSDSLNSFLNVVLFFPMGLLLPLFWIRFQRLWITLLFGFQISFLIEVLQIFTYRASDINDLITNTFGTLLGWITARLVLRLFPAIHASENRNDVYIVCISAFAVMYFVQPFFANWIFLYF